MRKIAVILFILVFCFQGYSQSITGKWKTIDPFSNKPSSVVDIYIKGGKLYGNLVEIKDVENPEKAICKDCPGQWKDKPIIGLLVFNGLTRDGNKWSGKDVFFSRKKKKTYDGSIWLEGDKLKIQIQLGLIKVSRKWVRAE